MVSLDTTRPDPLHACGGSRVPTPALDRIAAGGWVFREMISPAPITLPAHASLFTAQNPWRHGARENTEYALSPTATTLAEELRGEGYTTAAFVASFIMESRFGLDQGFELYDDRLQGPEPGLGPGTVELPGAIVSQRAARWLGDYGARRRSGAETRPFFLFAHYYDAHAPYAPPPTFAEQYRERPYDGELAYQDVCLGGLLDALEASGEASRTLIWVVSDHGESLGEHGEAGHSLFVYEATQKVVSVLRLPRQDERLRAGASSRVVEMPCGLVDVAPTLLELALPGRPESAETTGPWKGDGRSLVPILEGRALEDRTIYCETLSPWISYHWAPLFAVRSEHWKYIHAPERELYDLNRDPGELDNRAVADPARADEMERQLATLLSGEGAPSARRQPTAEEMERLRSLGYLSGPSEPSAQSTPSASSAPSAQSAASASSARIEGAPPRPEVDPLAPAVRQLPDPKEMVAFHNQQYQQAKGLLYAGRYLEAAEAFRGALQVDPLNNSLHLYLAGALRQAGLPAEAIPSYQQALRINPKSPRGWFGLGEAFLRLDQPDSAIVAFRRSIDLLPRAPEAWLRMGTAEWKRGSPRAAAAALETALEMGADPRAAHGQLARLYAGLPGQDQAAQRHLSLYAGILGVSTEEASKRLPPQP